MNFHLAIERGNLLVAEATLRVGLPRPTLVDLLELTALIALKDSGRHSRVAARCFSVGSMGSATRGSTTPPPRPRRCRHSTTAGTTRARGDKIIGSTQWLGEDGRRHERFQVLTSATG